MTYQPHQSEDPTMKPVAGHDVAPVLSPQALKVLEAANELGLLRCQIAVCSSHIDTAGEQTLAPKAEEARAALIAALAELDGARSLNILATFAHEVLMDAIKPEELDGRAHAALSRAGLLRIEDVAALTTSTPSTDPADVSKSGGGIDKTQAELEDLIDSAVHSDGEGVDYLNIREHLSSRLRAALSAQPSVAAMPEGWRLVPVEPTDEMLSADWDVTMSDAHSDFGVAACAWRAMLAASPEVAATGGGDGVDKGPRKRWRFHVTDLDGDVVWLDVQGGPSGEEPDAEFIGTDREAIEEADHRCTLWEGHTGLMAVKITRESLGPALPNAEASNKEMKHGE